MTAFFYRGRKELCSGTFFFPGEGHKILASFFNGEWERPGAQPMAETMNGFY